MPPGPAVEPYWLQHIRRVVRQFGYALVLRCPRCGQAPVLSGWFSVRPSCTACHFRFDRGESGYFMGAGCLNLVIAELVFAFGLLVTVVLTWPDPPWNGMLFVGIPLMIAVPMLSFPHSRTLWIAFDLTFRPVERHDAAEPGDGEDSDPRAS